jgi:hypothetical protein
LAVIFLHMERHRHVTRFTWVILCSALLAACRGSVDPEVQPKPSTAAPALKGDEPQAVAILVAAGRSLPAHTGFLGVTLDGQRKQTLTDAVLRETNLERVDPGAGGTVPFAVPSGGMGPRTSPTIMYSFASLRATADSAFVGANVLGLMGHPTTTTTCLVLARAGSDWAVVTTRVVAQATRCGQQSCARS